jgi:hypothetical protein
MAIIGQALTSPEAGWKRYEETYPGIKYLQSFTTQSIAGFSGGTERQISNKVGDCITFKISGTKLRFISRLTTDASSTTKITIDGVTESFNCYASTQTLSVLVYEKTGLSQGQHTVTISMTEASKWLYIDAIDIDSTGRLLHPDEVTNLNDLVVGKRIRASYNAPTSGVVGAFSGIGLETKDFIPVASSAIPNGDFYLLHVTNDFKGRRVIVADRNVQHSVSWDTLNTAGVATQNGIQKTIGADPTQWKTNIRLLTGGVSDATKANSEWDKYIVNGTGDGQYPAGDNTTWNWNTSVRSWTSSTSTDSTKRVDRGTTSNINYFDQDISSAAATTLGFRPVLVAESLVEPIQNKYLIQDGSTIKSFLNNSWSVVGTSPVTQVMFDASGMTDVSSLDLASLGLLTSTSPELLGWTDQTDPTRHVTLTGPLWQSVSDVLPSIEQFQTEGMTDLLTVPAEAWNLLTGDFDVITYTNLLEGNQNVKVNATPFGQLVLAETDFSNVDDLVVTASTIGVKLIASGNGGQSWKTFNGSWQDVSATVETAKVSGMTPSVFNAITTDQWKLLGSNVRLGYHVEDTGLVDQVTVTKSAVATVTPTLDSMKVTFDDLTIEGRMKDIEQINAVNMAKLQFKSNILMQSDKYELHDIVIDTFESSTTVDTSNAVYDTTNKEFGYDTAVSAPAIQEVILPEEVMPTYRKKFMLNADHAGNISYEYSLDGGTTWNTITPFTIIDLTGQVGINLKVKAKLKDSTAKLRGIAFSWA